MNANELANELERPNNWQQENNFTTQAATMLRQQAADNQLLNDTITVCEEHIERLKAEIEASQAEKERLFASMLDMALDSELKDLKYGKAQEK